GERRRQHLDRHLALEPRVGGAVHLAHAALAELAGDLVGADARAGGDGRHRCCCAARATSAPKPSTTSRRWSSPSSLCLATMRRRPGGSTWKPWISPSFGRSTKVVGVPATSRGAVVIGTERIWSRLSQKITALPSGRQRGPAPGPAETATAGPTLPSVRSA